MCNLNEKLYDEYDRRVTEKHMFKEQQQRDDKEQEEFSRGL